MGGVYEGGILVGVAYVGGVLVGGVYVGGINIGEGILHVSVWVPRVLL